MMRFSAALLSQIVVELFIPDPAGWVRWEYDRSFGTLQGEQLILFREEMRGQKPLDHNFPFKALHLGELKRPPDW